MIANFPGVSASMEQVAAAIEAVAPEVSGRITWEETSLPFPPTLEARALEHLLGPLPPTPLLEGIGETIERFRGAAAF